ncbi:hypothetical protein B0H13DRAFT_1851291 [Mycena leptocephala]|nr:hypothetical protein B0H13DRAFT_1851291 [Mycena leptocephala]
MTGTGATDIPPNESQNDMQTAVSSQPVSGRILDESIEEEVNEGRRSPCNLITHETVEVDYDADPAFVGVDLSSLNPTAMRQPLTTQRAIQAAIAAVPMLEPPPKPSSYLHRPKMTVTAKSAAAGGGFKNQAGSATLRPLRSCQNAGGPAAKQRCRAACSMNGQGIFKLPPPCLILLLLALLCNISFRYTIGSCGLGKGTLESFIRPILKPGFSGNRSGIKPGWPAPNMAGLMDSTSD